MTSIVDLSVRVLEKLGVRGVGDADDASDNQKALQKLRAAQYLLESEDLLRWTEHDIPRYAEEPLVMIAAYLAAEDFGQNPKADWLMLGKSLIARGVGLNLTHIVTTDYF